MESIPAVRGTHRRLKVSYGFAIVLALVVLASSYVWLTARWMERDALNRELMMAITANQPEEALALLWRGAEPNGRVENQQARGGFLEFFRTLFGRRAKRDAGYSEPFLLLALWRKQPDVARDLLNRGADPRTKGAGGDTALMYAALGGYEDIVKTLLDRGADPNAVDGQGTTTLMYALRGGHPGIIQTLLSRCRDLARQTKAVNAEGEDALLCAAEGGDADAVRFLLDRGMAVNTTDKQGTTPLMRSAERGHVESTQLLLDRGAKANARDRTGQTALTRAAMMSWLAVRVLAPKRTETKPTYVFTIQRGGFAQRVAGGYEIYSPGASVPLYTPSGQGGAGRTQLLEAYRKIDRMLRKAEAKK